MSKYIDLLKESKESRIMDILRETEKFLKEIGVRIMLSKQGNLEKIHAWSNIPDIND